MAVAPAMCMQCGRLIDGRVITLDGETYCCLGCGGGGPCTCEETVHPLESVDLRTGPFPDQDELLHFAVLLERAPGLRRVELTRADPQDARFAVLAPSPAEVARAVKAVPGYFITVETIGGTVTAHVALEAPPPTRTPPPSTAESGGEMLLPGRTRFRVFRLAADGQPLRPQSLPPSPLAPPVTTPAIPGARLATPASRPARPPANETRPEPEPPDRHPGPWSTSPATTLPPQGAAPGGTLAPQQRLTLVVHPFHSFAALNEFRTSVQALEGVCSIRVRRLYGGTLHLAVHYEHAVPFARRLEDLRGVRVQAITGTADVIQLLLESSPDPAPGHERA